VRCEATQFAVAATDHNELQDRNRSDWSQPRRTGSRHTSLVSDEMRSDEVRWDGRYERAR